MNGAALLSLVVTLAPPGGVVLDRAVPKLLIGRQFQDALQQPLSAEWKNVPLRGVLRRISEARATAVLLDRGIDPTAITNVQFQRIPLRDALKTIARKNRAGLSVVGNSVYIGPTSATKKLRTLIRLRQQERSDRSRRLSATRRRQLVARRTVHWNDLDRPADLIEQIAGKYRLTVSGLDRVPHDLWAGATLPDATVSEALSLVLIQFDLTFSWTEHLAGIRIVSAPKRVTIEKSYRPRHRSVVVAVRRWREEIPGIDVTPAGKSVLVRGTVEQHEALAALLHPRKRRPGGKAAPPGRRTFTLRVNRVPLDAIMKKFEAAGYTFRYDPRSLRTAGIRLDSKVSLDIKDAMPQSLFTALFKQVGLTVQVEGQTVRLVPKSE